MGHDVFISYAEEEQAVAHQICSTFEQHGISCWIAPRDVRPGMNYGEAILDAIDQSRTVVFLLSAAANKSEFVWKELECAVSNHIPIFTFRVADVQPARSIKFFITGRQFLDALTPPRDAEIQRLRESVTRQLRAPGQASDTLHVDLDIFLDDDPVETLPRRSPPAAAMPGTVTAPPSLTIDTLDLTQDDLSEAPAQPQAVPPPVMPEPLPPHPAPFSPPPPAVLPPPAPTARPAQAEPGMPQGMWAFILGLIGLIICWPVSLVAIVLAIIAMSRSSGKVWAIWGLVLGILGVIWGAIAITLLCSGGF